MRCINLLTYLLTLRTYLLKKLLTHSLFVETAYPKRQHRAMCSRTSDDMLMDIARKVDRVLRQTAMTSIDQLLADDDTSRLVRRQSIPLHPQ